MNENFYTALGRVVAQLSITGARMLCAVEREAERRGQPIVDSHVDIHPQEDDNLSMYVRLVCADGARIERHAVVSLRDLVNAGDIDE